MMLQKIEDAANEALFHLLDLRFAWIAERLHLVGWSLVGSAFFVGGTVLLGYLPAYWTAPLMLSVGLVLVKMGPIWLGAIEEDAMWQMRQDGWQVPYPSPVVFDSLLDPETEERLAAHPDVLAASPERREAVLARLRYECVVMR